MKLNKITLAMMAATLLVTSCKDDSETDLFLPSDLTGLYINEVFAANPDWVELYNNTDKEMDLSNFILQDDKGASEEFVFPVGTKIAAKSHLVLNAGADFEFGISSSKGDELTLLDTKGSIVDRIIVPVTESNQSYHRVEDGGAMWAISNAPSKGSANGTGNTTPTPEPSNLKLYVNEVMASPVEGESDFIELYNDEEVAIDLSGFILEDDGGRSKAFTIPTGVSIPAKGILVFNQVDKTDPSSFNFGLSGTNGDVVKLFEASGALVDEVKTPIFEVAGQSYARIGNGGSQWQVVDQPTKGEANSSTPLVSFLGKLVINEVYTFSPQKTIDDLDFIELYNKSDEALDISGLRMWESGGSERFWPIPQGTTLAPKGRYLVECDKYELHESPTNYPNWGLSKGPDEYIVIADGMANVIDSIATPSLKEFESYGRKTDGSAEWQIFAMHTKGAANTGIPRQVVTNTIGLYINEVFTNNQKMQSLPWDDSRDYIELYNSSDVAIDLEGYEMFDDTEDDSKKYVFQAGEVVPAKGFLVKEVYKDGGSLVPTFGLGKGGDWVFIYTPGKGKLVAEIEAPAFGNDDIHTIGRKTDGSSEIVVFTEPSKGISNNGKAILN